MLQPVTLDWPHQGQHSITPPLTLLLQQGDKTWDQVLWLVQWFTVLNPIELSSFLHNYDVND